VERIHAASGASEGEVIARDFLHRHVDLDFFTSASLGSRWNALETRQQVQFSRELQTLLAATIRHKVQQIDTVRVRSLSSHRPREHLVVVTGRIESSRPHEVALVYDARTPEAGIRDVRIDDVSVLRNYRAHFTKVHRTRGFTGLIESLQRARRRAR
jgi:ABC-type transporter MlaC component